MSTATAERKIPSAITGRIRGLRRKLTGWLLIDGFSRLLLAVLILVLFDALIDRVFKMDGPQRIIMLCVMAAVVLGVLFWRVIKPLFNTVSDDALILQVEDHNKELKEGLISSVQFARDGSIEKQGVSKQLVQATIDRGVEMARSIDFGKSLNGSRQATNMLLLLVGLIGLGALGYGVAKTDFWRTWFNRNVLLSDDQWPQNTYLIVEGVVDGKKIMKRGEDHLQMVFVDAERSRIAEVDVTLEINSLSGRSSHKMQRSEHQHQYEFRSVSNPFKFRVRGGDHVSAWIQVELVEPPSMSELDLWVVLPEYAGSKLEPLPKGSGPHGVMEGSSLKLTAVSNKPLSKAELRHETGDVMVLDAADDTHFSLTIPQDKLVGGKYTFMLEDKTGMTSSRPSSFQLKIQTDRAPRVRASITGVSGMIVSKAKIPISFTAKDEYAITGAEHYLYWLGDVESSVKQELNTPVPGLEDQLGQAAIQNDSVYDLKDLNIPVDVGLRLKVLVTDNNTSSGPGVGESREFLLRVVTEEQLRSDLLRREIEQRQAFEFALKNQELLTVDLRALAAAHLASPQPDEATNKLIEMQRRQKVIGTNLVGISDRFEAFLIEAKNNRLDESAMELDQGRSIEKRLKNQIIDPIRALDDAEIYGASASFDQIRRSVDDPAAMNQAATQTADLQEIIQEKMREILAAMEDSETYQQIINQAIETKLGQKEVQKMLEKKRREAQNQIFGDDEE